MSVCIQSDAINLFLSARNRKPINGTLNDRWNVKIYNPENDVNFPHYNKFDFIMREYIEYEPHVKYINIFFGSRNVLDELGFCLKKILPNK